MVQILLKLRLKRYDKLNGKVFFTGLVYHIMKLVLIPAHRLAIILPVSVIDKLCSINTTDVNVALYIGD